MAKRAVIHPPARSAGEPKARQRGFTLLEVLVAVAILAISLTSLLGSQMQALRATRYAQQVTAAAFLAEYQLVEIEYVIQQEEDGWGENDREFEGDFAEQGWPDMNYSCLVDMIEMPDYTAIQAAMAAADTDGGGMSDQTGVQDTGEQAVDMLGMVWPMIKEAIEQSIRRSSCKVTWLDGKIEHEFEVMTFWTDASKLDQIQQAGGESGEEDDSDSDDDDGGGGDPGGPDGPGGGRGGEGGPTRPGIGGGPQTPPSQRGR